MQHKLGKTVFVKESYDMLKKKLTCRGLKPKRTTCLGWDSGEVIFPNLKFRKALQNKFCCVTGSGSWDADTIFYKSKRNQLGITKEGEKRRTDKGAFLADVAKSSPQQERLWAVGHTGMKFWSPSEENFTRKISHFTSMS